MKFSNVLASFALAAGFGALNNVAQASQIENQIQLTPYTSFTQHGNHSYAVNLPVDGIAHENLTLEIELGCAEVGCSDWDYTVRFEWLADDGQKYELGRLITPYAGFMQRNMMGFDRNWRRKYLFDVTDFAPVLKGEGELIVHYGGWSAKKSAFGFAAKLISKGEQTTQEVKRVIPVYRSNSEGWAYKTAEQFAEFLAPQNFTLTADEVSAELKVTVSAHGHALSFNNPEGKPELCGEWCDRYFDLMVNAKPHVRQQLWRTDCDQSATHPQAGTYLFSRANWCPGEIVEPFSYPLDIQSENLTLDIDWQNYSWQPSQWGNSAPRYIVSAHLVTYGAKKQATDLAVEQILSPNKHLDNRHTQSCGQVEVLLSNKGQITITEANFAYGITTSNTHNFNWQGELQPGQSKVVTLPGFNFGLFDPQTQPLTVTATTDGDFNDGNNSASSYIETPLMLNKGSELVIAIDKAPQDTSIVIKDRLGNEVLSWQEFNEAQTENLPLDLIKGCYTLEIQDSGRDGLFNHFTQSRQGRGSATFVDHSISDETKNITLEPDFGRLLKVPFTYDYPLGGCKEAPWQTNHAYANAGELVSYQGKVYRARHWSYNFQPDQSGPWDAWEAVMYCDGSAL